MENTPETTHNCDSNPEHCDHQNGCCGGHSTDNVTREQGGQFIDEGGMMFTRSMEEAALDGTGDAQLQDGEYASVNALNVNLDRSGADYIHAQKSFLTNSGARQITSDSSKLTNSGVLTLNAETAEFKQSSAVVARTGSLDATDSNIVFASAESATFGGSGNVTMLQSRQVDASGDINAFAILGGELRAGGNVNTKFDTASAAAFGAAFAFVLLVLGKLFGKK